MFVSWFKSYFVWWHVWDIPLEMGLLSNVFTFLKKMFVVCFRICKKKKEEKEKLSKEKQIYGIVVGSMLSPCNLQATNSPNVHDKFSTSAKFS